MNDHFKRKLDAIGDIIGEMAEQLFLDGEYEEQIKEAILEGAYDVTILEHLDGFLPTKLMGKIKEYFKEQ